MVKYLVYELCNKDKSSWGYGVFDSKRIEDIELSKIIDMVEAGQIDNAIINKGIIKLPNCKSALPRFYKDNYILVDNQLRVYVVCKCYQDGIKGYLVIDSTAHLRFVTRSDLVTIGFLYETCNIRLQKLHCGAYHPVQFNMPFKNIGNIELKVGGSS